MNTAKEKTKTIKAMIKRIGDKSDPLTIDINGIDSLINIFKDNQDVAQIMIGWDGTMLLISLASNDMMDKIRSAIFKK